MSKYNPKKYLKLVLGLILRIVFVLLIIGLPTAFYIFKQEEKKEQNYINSIKNEINDISKSISLSGSVNGDNLNIEIKNIGSKDILGLRFFIEFENIFGDELYSCEESCYTFEDYDSKTNIELQEVLNRDEVFTYRRNYDFGKRIGSGIGSNVKKVSKTEKIKISKMFIYEVIFADNTKKDLSEICFNPKYQPLSNNEIRLYELCDNNYTTF